MVDEDDRENLDEIFSNEIIKGLEGDEDEDDGALFDEDELRELNFE